MNANSATETIVAIATPPGKGGVGIVRLSGSQARRIGAEIAGALPTDRQASLRDFRDAKGIIDNGLVLCFPTSSSYTGESVVELQAHGSPVLLDLLVKRAVELGARIANPGEFTLRAFLNGQLDLTEAEAVADLIDAGSEAAARAAARSLTGVFSHQVHSLATRLESLRIEIEAGIDFSDEELDLVSDRAFDEALASSARSLETLLRQAGHGRLLQEGRSIVIAGRPNAGKSSLLNALAEQDVAIVSDVPGTTRDVLKERVNVCGLPLTFIDTAGLRATDDPLEKEGIRRARAQILQAHHVLFLVDLTDERAQASAHADMQNLLPGAQSITRIYTKGDLVEGRRDDGLTISTRHADTIAALKSHIASVVGLDDEEGQFIARRRHIEALQRVQAHLILAGSEALKGQADLIAEELRLAHHALGEITGKVSSDDLLGKIFSTFCIGK